MGLDSNLTLEKFLEISKNLSNSQLYTISQKKPFNIEVSQNGLKIIIENGKLLPATLSTIETFCDIYNKSNQSLNTTLYKDDIGVSAYLRAIIYIHIENSKTKITNSELSNLNYWWVNQNQTYKHEVGGGYMWSPKTNSDGGRNQFYINMTLVKPGDIVYSYCDTYIRAIGVVKRKAITSTKPTEFGSAGANWTDSGWLVEVEFRELDHPVKPSKHMDQLTPTLPERYSPIRSDGRGNQVYLANIPSSMASVLNNLLNSQVEQIYAETSKVNYEQFEHLDDKHELELLNRKDIPETEKQQLVNSRRGQGVELHSELTHLAI